jgi:hypothetical protein
MSNDNGSPKTMRGGRRDGRIHNPGPGLTVTPAEKVLLRGIRDARRRLLGSGNQFDMNVADELKAVADEWSDLTGLTFPSDKALDKKENETWADSSTSSRKEKP